MTNYQIQLTYIDGNNKKAKLFPINTSEDVVVGVVEPAISLSLPCEEEEETLATSLSYIKKYLNNLENVAAMKRTISSATDLDDASSLASSKAVYTVQSMLDSIGTSVNNFKNDYAIKDHASKDTSYGRGTDTLYGHVLLTDAYDTKVTNGAAAYGLAVSQNALYGAYKALTDEKAPNNHASTETTYGLADTTKYGHVKLSNVYKKNVLDEDTTDALAASQSALYSAYTDIQKSISDMGEKAPTNHADTTTKYGQATNNLYGHVLVDDRYASKVTDGAAANGMAASQNALYNAYSTLLEKIDNIDVPESISYATASVYGIVRLSDTYSSKVTNGAAADSLAASQNALYNAYSNRAPISHRSSATTYGVGTGTYYGHVKLSDTYDSSVSSGAAANGLAASQNALYNAYAALLEKINDIDSSGSVSNATASVYGLVKLSDTYTSKLSSGAAADGVAASQNALYNAYANRAPISHRSSATTYGVGTSSYYGHVKLSDTYATSVTNGTAANGMAASQNALYGAYNALNTGKANTSHTHDYLPLTGGTLTGQLIIRSDAMNGTYNGLIIGDDCYIGDCNVANTVGLMGGADNNIAYLKFGKLSGLVGYNGTHFMVENILTTPQVIATNADGFRIKQGNYSIIMRNDSADFYILITNSGDPDGSWSTLRPFRINLATGYVYHEHALYTGDTYVGNYIQLYNNSEGGNVRVIGPSGSTYCLEMDCYDNYGRIYSSQDGGANASAAVYFTGPSVQLYRQGYSKVIFDGAQFYCSKTNYASCGYPSYLWTVVYAKSGTISTSDRTKKHDIFDISEVYEKLFFKLQPKTYIYNDGDRTHVGAISQDVEESLEEVGLEAKDFAGFCKDVHYDYDVDEEGNQIIDTKREGRDEDGNLIYDYSLRYQEFIFLNTHMIQKLYKRVDELEEEKKDLEDRITKLEALLNQLLEK